MLSCITIVNGLPTHYEENRLYFLYFPSFTASKNVFAGLNAGTEWAGITMVVFFEMLRAFFSALCLMMKLPNPRRNTSFPAIIDSLTLSMNASTTVVATDFSIPVSCAIRAIISAFVRLFYYKIRCKDNNISLCRLDCQPDNVTENDNPPLSHGVPSARTRQSESPDKRRET